MRTLKAVVRTLIPTALLVGAVAPRSRWQLRAVCLAALLGYWLTLYLRYRRTGRAQTKREWELLRSVRWDAFWRHYNEDVPTIEQELEIWGPYHEHRHNMRYQLVADEVIRHLPPHGRVLDVGCGSALVADLINHFDGSYVGLDFPDPHITYAASKYADFDGALHVAFARADAAKMPFASNSFDVVVMSEVIEHLIRPELAVWEIARVLRPNGVFVMTTNNASEVPLRSPLVNPFAWIEKMVGAYFPRLISVRPWVWPERVDRALLPDGSPDVYLPHSHHIYGETTRMFQAAGLSKVSWLTFEFPPPQSRIARRLARMDGSGRRVADLIESVARAIPGVRKLGTHVFIVSRKTGVPIAANPPAGVWPGPFSDGSELH